MSGLCWTCIDNPCSCKLGLLKKRVKSEFDVGYKCGVHEAQGVIEKVKRENEVLKNILKDLMTTKECRRTWIEEMCATIDAVLNGDD
tara:strand:+ start:639 stop:899 length:261 start_codon:yes stop_codon:yes gene_type:complete